MAGRLSKYAPVGRTLLLMGVVLAVGAAIGQLLSLLKEEAPKKESGALAPLVDSVIIESGKVTEKFRGYGTVVPDRRAALSAEISAAVVELVDGIEAGSPVKQGQELVRLDERQYQRDLDRILALGDADQAQLLEIAVREAGLEKLITTSETEVEIAANEVGRVKELLDAGNAERREYDLTRLVFQRARRELENFRMELATLGPGAARVRASLRGNEAAADLARLNLERCHIKAPFSGRLQELNVEVGDSVRPGSPLLTLIDPTRVEIPIQLPSAVYHLVKVGTTCVVEAGNAPGRSWRGSVVRIAPAAAQETRTFSAYVEVDNTLQAQPLVPGTFVRAVVDGPTHTDALLVPRSAIRRGHVLVIEGQQARKRAVTIEALIADRALVTGDIRSGDRVILSHLDSLEQGSRVRLPEPAPPIRASVDGSKDSHGGMKP